MNPRHRADCAPIVKAVAQGCDALLLDLHGAMAVDGYDDPEGELLACIRKIAPKVQIAAAFDLHGNFSPVTFANPDIVTGYCTYPHIGMYETGRRAGRTLLRMLAAESRPQVIWCRLPMLTHMNRQTPAEQPMEDIKDRAMAAEAAGEVLNASIFGGFPLADIPWVGLTVAVVADVNRLPGAQALADGPVVFADHGDNVAVVGVSDDPTVLAEVLRQGLTDVIAGPYIGRTLPLL
jgi:microcystin degradation protein MlrC